MKQSTLSHLAKSPVALVLENTQLWSFLSLRKPMIQYCWMASFTKLSHFACRLIFFSAKSYLEGQTCTVHLHPKTYPLRSNRWCCTTEYIEKIGTALNAVCHGHLHMFHILDTRAIGPSALPHIHVFHIGHTWFRSVSPAPYTLVPYWTHVP